MDSSALQRAILIIFGVILVAQSCYGNLDCKHVKKELEPCYYYMQHDSEPNQYPSQKCCEELKEEVKHFDHKYQEYEYFYCCVKQLYDYFTPAPPNPPPRPPPPPPPPPAKRLEDLMKKCNIIPPYKIPGPPYPNCPYEN